VSPIALVLCERLALPIIDAPQLRIEARRRTAYA
jgi:hypothetical protein